MDTAVGYSVQIRAFRLALTVQGLRPHTIANYIRDVDRFLSHLDGRALKSVRPIDVNVYFAAYRQNRSPKTIHEAQLAVRRFFRFFVAEGELKKDPTKEMKLTRYRVDPQPTYTEEEVRRLLLACHTRSREGIRNKALVTVLYDSGVREGELVSMSLPDWEQRTVRVTGKTGVRQVYLGFSSILAIERYLRRWKVSDGPLWRGKKGPLTGSGVFQAIRRLCNQAGVANKGVHAFRRAAAAQMKRLGMSDSDILEVMGWNSIAMLRRYTASVAGELANAAHQRFSPGDALGVR